MLFHAGWTGLRYFDMEEHQVFGTSVVACIPKLGPEWKVIHEFKLEANLEDLDDQEDPEDQEDLDDQEDLEHLEHPAANCRGKGLWVKFGDEYYILSFSANGVKLKYDGFIEVITHPIHLPRIGEWTRIELTHEVDEEKPGRCTISLSIAGILVLKDNTYLDDLGEEQDATIGLGLGRDQELPMLGVMRGLAVLEKS